MCMYTQARIFCRTTLATITNHWLLCQLKVMTNTAIRQALSPKAHTPSGTPATAIWLKMMMKSEEHTSELQSRPHLVCRLLLEKKKKKKQHKRAIKLHSVVLYCRQ